SHISPVFRFNQKSLNHFNINSAGLLSFLGKILEISVKEHLRKRQQLWILPRKILLLIGWAIHLLKAQILPNKKDVEDFHRWCSQGNLIWLGVVPLLYRDLVVSFYKKQS